MSEVIDYKNIDWSAVQEQIDDVSGETYKQVGDLRLNKGEFDAAPGAVFWVPELKGIEVLGALYSQETVLNLINTALNNGLRIKARGKLPDYADAEEKKKAYDNIKTNGLIILTETDAVNYTPGERELSAAAYMRNAQRELKKGNKEAARALFLKAKAATERELALLM